MAHRAIRSILLTAIVVALGCDTPADVEVPPSAGAAKAEAAEVEAEPAPAPEAEAEVAPEVAAGPEPARPTSGWACTCLQEKGAGGAAVDATLCRRSFADCGGLQRRAGTGSKTLVRNSVAEAKGCRWIGEAEHPGELLGGVEGWEPSVKDGAFARPGACVLPDDPASTLPLDYAIGPLKLGMSAAEVEALLGPPAKKGKIWEEGATGDFVQDWRYPDAGIDLGMAAATRRGDQTVSQIRVFAPCDYQTNLGVGIGSDFEEAKERYARFAAPAMEQPGPGGFIAGSIYGGVFLDAGDDGKVASIFIGAGAE